MINFIINNLKNLDLKVKNIMKYGFIFSLLLCLFATLILFTYHQLYTIPLVFTIGTLLFKTSLLFFVEFIVCGIAFDTIRKQMI